MKRIAIIGAGLSGLTAAWQLLEDDASLDVTVFEAADRAGGIIDTVRQDGFVIEMGPDSWVTEKPAARELATELGLADELLSSNDDTRKTLLLLDGWLMPLPDNMRMMVPIGREALAGIDASPLLTPEARRGVPSGSWRGRRSCGGRCRRRMSRLRVLRSGTLAGRCCGSWRRRCSRVCLGAMYGG